MAKKNKIVLIIDTSLAFLRDKTREIYADWGFKREDVKELTEWEFIPKTPSLFGDIQMTHLDLSAANDLKNFAALISDKKTKESFVDNWYGNGVIITAVNAKGTKKIEKLVLDSGGVIFKKEKSDTRKKEMFNKLALSNEVKIAVNSYVGEDYDLMISFTNEISKLSKEEQQALSVEAAFSFFPPIPGSVPPWDFMNALMNSNLPESISLFYRTIQHTHVLVCMLFLQKKMSLLYRVRLAMDDGYYDSKSIANAMNENNGPELWNVLKLAKKITSKDAERIALLTDNLESDLKGGSAVDSNSEFIFVLTQIGMILKF